MEILELKNTINETKNHRGLNCRMEMTDRERGKKNQ